MVEIEIKNNNQALSHSCVKNSTLPEHTSFNVMLVSGHKINDSFLISKSVQNRTILDCSSKFKKLSKFFNLFIIF